MRYRSYQPADFDALYAIEEACFEPALRFPRAYMRMILSRRGSLAWVAEDDRGLAGFAVVSRQKTPEGPVAYIETIEVSTDRREQGVGRELLRCIEHSARVMGIDTMALHVDEENRTAIQLYESADYEKRGREENFYPNRHPALIYAKRICPPAADL